MYYNITLRRAFWKAALLCVRGLFNPQPAETAAASLAVTRGFVFAVFFFPERGNFFVTRSLLFAGFLFPERPTFFVTRGLLFALFILPESLCLFLLLQSLRVVD
jgi:hypothetical protein